MAISGKRAVAKANFFMGANIAKSACRGKAKNLVKNMECGGEERAAAFTFATACAS
jgi:hypothetical protein